MEPIVYLIRHAEAEHNVSKDFSQRDPPLTPLGLSQAGILATTFPDLSSVAIVLTSPLLRALQTALAGFSHIIAGHGVEDSPQVDRVKLLIDPDLEEKSDLPCDTGSDRATLAAAFPHLDFSGLDENWFAKSGLHAADEASVILRARIAREKLWDITVTLKEENWNTNTPRAVIVVTHGVFMKFLSQDMDIDLPKAGWKAFHVRKNIEGQVVLLPV
ncbi:hypothetical protein Purlil1_13906 [Purpureocillium lilacinum]|uniref:Phosphoglycerate mutase family protein n=1 Tax=Purpureocillium lilacinum TaxID=33203 RepID=A0ABR0BCS7_PURLI|nr:hypothetical protein Purlil1_13906 [Purpureocillium lilacinum]